MKWRIPAKTFLIGEYAAIEGGSAIILTTTPCFTVSLVEGNQHEGIHPDSPAGQWWATHRIPAKSLAWHDPYHGIGGLGASSAQFIGAYLASCHLLHVKPSQQVLLDAYFQSCWNGEGVRPSGYDVTAQTQNRCVYINRRQHSLETYDWVFDDIAFLLLHSGEKLATHYHLRHHHLATLSTTFLSNIAEQARQAFKQGDSGQLIDAINAYQQELQQLHLTSVHSLDYLTHLKEKYPILAAKGCGAMGADVLLLIMPADGLALHSKNLLEEGWVILASSQDLYKGKTLLKNNPPKTLEILP